MKHAVLNTGRLPPALVARLSATYELTNVYEQADAVRRDTPRPIRERHGFASDEIRKMYL